MKKMKPLELQAIVARQIEQATGTYGDDLNAKRSNLMQRYMAEPYGDEAEGRSAVLTSEVADTIEWIMPELVDVFASTERAVEFDPVGPEDEQAAEQETDVVNYVVMRKNQFFLLIYEWLKDGLLQKNGYVKRYWDVRERTTVEEYADLDPEELTAILSKIEGEYEIEEYSGGLNEETGEYEPLDVKIRCTKELQELRVETVPPEEVILSPRWHSVCLEGIPFIAHKRDSLTISDLIEMGFDRKQVEALPRADDEEFGDMKTERFETRDATEYDDGEESDPTMRTPMVYEVYIKADYNGDGIAEQLRCWVGGPGYEMLKKGGKVAVEEVDSIPFSAFTPIIIPHRHFGRSIAETVDDLQRIKTVLTRQLLDNVYLLNHGRPEIAEAGMGQHTVTDLLNSRPGAAIRTAEPGMLRFHYPGDVVSGALQSLEYIDSLRENRTGVTRYNQGLDADSLNKTATGIRQIMTAAQKKIALIARIFAETALKDLYLGIHRDLRKGPVKEMALKLRNEWVQVDPRVWADRTDMTVRVGLGTGDRESKRAGLLLIAQFQEKMLAGGLGMVRPEHVYATAERLVENEGFSSADAFFADPSREPPMPKQAEGGADPAQLLAQVEMQKAQMDAQAKERENMLKMQIETQKMQLEFMKMRMEDDRKRDDTNVRAAVDLQKAAMQGRTQVGLETVRALNQPPAPVNNG